ncbi:hypothetical protein ACJVDH_03480 [Pedobacter sp. AW1-32]|uniref:hypothetical protein n=1 Tax=Pedobacter sp. AW1-32 TaxID=3383026 RepID=UPI003FF0FE74
MKNTITILSLAMVALSACTSENKDKTQLDSAYTSMKSISNRTQCYSYIKNRDTANLKIDFDGDKFTGVLNYNLFEKDKNAGTIAGIVKGDTLLADYTFNAEGTTSVREVAWITKGDSLQEGYGDVEDLKGKAVFKNYAKLRFDKSLIFEKTDCK